MMSALIDNFTPSAGQLAGLGAVLLCAFAMSLIGMVAAGRHRLDEGGLIYGWAIVGAIFTVIGAAALPFTWIALLLAALGVAACAALLAREQGLGNPAPARILVIAAPLLLLVAAMTPSQWDDFTQWLPNARFLLEHDQFPRGTLPDSPSVFPAYPHGLTFAIYLASRVTGALVENAGAIFNLLLLLSAGLLVARLVRGALARPDRNARLPLGLSAPPENAAGWGYCALGALAVTVLNPTFVPKVAFTAYADTATAVTLGFAAALGWMALNAIADGERERARAFAWQMGLAATALINLKQVNLVLLAVTICALGIVALRDAKIGLRALLPLAPRAIALPLIVYAAWRLHVRLEIEDGEFSLPPYDAWMLHLIPETLSSMAYVASNKGGYFGLMLVALFFGGRALRRVRGDFDRLALIAATLFVGYNGFLLFAYVTSFSEYEARRAASYWRYNMHLGIVGVLFAAYGIALLWRRHVTPRWRPRLAWLAVVLVLALPAAMSHKLRFDLEKRYVYARAVGAEINRMLSPDDLLLLIDPRSDGDHLVILRYAMHGSARITREISAFDDPVGEAVRATLRDAPPTHVWVHEPVPGLSDVLGRELAPGSSYLLARQEGGWQIIGMWPYPNRRA